jgi:hypothetical protein
LQRAPTKVALFHFRVAQLLGPYEKGGAHARVAARAQLSACARRVHLRRAAATDEQPADALPME